MKTAKSIIFILFVLLTAQIASAYYCPSTGRWLSRDPMSEPGFEAVRATSGVLKIGQISGSIPMPPRRWINRDAFPTGNESNGYAFAGNNSLTHFDALGLAQINNNGNFPQNEVDDINKQINSACGHGFWNYVMRNGRGREWCCIGDKCQTAKVNLERGTPKDPHELYPVLGNAGSSGLSGGCNITLYPENGNSKTQWGGVALHEFAHCCIGSHAGMQGVMVPPWDGSGNVD